MEITLVATSEKKEVIVKPVEDEDFKLLIKRRYFFEWKSLKEKASLYKLCVRGDKDILGVMALVDVPQEKRIELKLLASSKENAGKNKIYDGIAGCLIAYACRKALKKYGNLACVSLVPKTKLKSYYITKYGMTDGGWQLFVEGKHLNDLIKKYLS